MSDSHRPAQQAFLPEGTCAPPETFGIGGFVPFSTVDFPGKLAAVVFCQGCPWRCTYCHNPDLQNSRSRNGLTWRKLFRRIEQRHGLLDAVVFSGGEPTAQAALPRAAAQVRSAGFRVGLHTAGIYPNRLVQALPSVDWVGLDIKSLPGQYAALTGARNSAARAWHSLAEVIRSGVDYEVRTTVHPDLISALSLRKLADSLAAFGVKRFALQSFRRTGCADAILNRSLKPDYLTPEFCALIGAAFEHFELRDL